MIKMDANGDWQLEMRRLMEVFEVESTNSLRKINRCFVALDRPFNEDFRQYYLKMSTLRLDSSFNTILFERLDESQMQTPAATIDNGIENIQNGSSPPVNNAGLLNALQEKTAMEVKTEDSINAPIEIIDSNDDSVGAKKHVERRVVNDAIDVPIGSNTPQNIEETNGNPDGEHDGTNLNEKNDAETHVKCELKAEIEEEMVDLPLEVFDPVKENESASVSESMDDRIQASAPSSCLNEAKQVDGKRFKCKRCEYTSNRKSHFQSHRLSHEAVKPFKCDHCDYAARHKCNLTAHQRTHDSQKLLGVAQDPKNGLFKCPHCDQRFAKWNNLKQHLEKLHKNNQRLFNCVRCMRRFTQKSKKDRHEARCQNRRYECHLCKTYGTRSLVDMQKHMRKHSGAKPFACAICKKCFKQKAHLGRHLNSVHNRINT